MSNVHLEGRGLGLLISGKNGIMAILLYVLPPSRPTPSCKTFCPLGAGDVLHYTQKALRLSCPRNTNATKAKDPVDL